MSIQECQSSNSALSPVKRSCRSKHRSSKQESSKSSVKSQQVASVYKQSSFQAVTQNMLLPQYGVVKNCRICLGYEDRIETCPLMPLGMQTNARQQKKAESPVKKPCVPYRKKETVLWTKQFQYYPALSYKDHIVFNDKIAASNVTPKSTQRRRSQSN